MRRIALLVIATVACVPASEPAPPAGAWGYLTEPSAATRGEPFVTDDGWVVRIEKVVLGVTIMSSSQGAQGSSFGGYAAWRFDASRPVEIYAPKVPEGLATGSVTLSGSYIFDKVYDHATSLDLPDEVLARFLRPAEVVSQAGGSSQPWGPSALLAVRAQKDERTVAFDLTLYTRSPNLGGTRALPVRADALTALRLAVRAEAFFSAPSAVGLRADGERSLTEPSPLHFEPFAEADVDLDGVLTAAELAQKAAQCGNLAPRSYTCYLVDTLTANAARLLVEL